MKLLSRAPEDYIGPGRWSLGAYPGLDGLDSGMVVFVYRDHERAREQAP